MKCVKCNNVLVNDTKFCTKCGSEVEVVLDSKIVLKKFFSDKWFLTVGITLSVFVAALLGSFIIGTSNFIFDILKGTLDPSTSSEVLPLFIAILIMILSLGIPVIGIFKLYKKASSNLDIDSNDMDFSKKIGIITSVCLGASTSFVCIYVISFFNSLLSQAFTEYFPFAGIIAIVYLFMVVLMIGILLHVATYITLGNILVAKIDKYYKEGIKPRTFVKVIAILLCISAGFSFLGMFSLFTIVIEETYLMFLTSLISYLGNVFLQTALAVSLFKFISYMDGK